MASAVQAYVLLYPPASVVLSCPEAGPLDTPRPPSGAAPPGRLTTLHAGIHRPWIGAGCICAVVLLPLGELAYKTINGDRPPPSSTRTPGH
jgi:hypothetical protein